MGRADYSKESYIPSGAALWRRGQACREDHHGTQYITEKPQKDAVPDATRRACTRVLVVDDDDDVREIVAEHLMAQGYGVVLAATGQSACDIMRPDQNISIVVSDVMMPGMDGVTLASLLRARRPNLPVVFITGYSSTYDLRGEMVLAKPFTAAALAALVAKGLHRVASC